MKCEALDKNFKECTEEAITTGVVFTMNGPITVNACEEHSKRIGFFEDKAEEELS
ncbi:hypothetical protein [Bacillus sp. TH13]|uniref:hypothetical protein n=1 Tax=Bacillus sp. TH13 TaxID=2796379 RepID=UPI0019136A80|nr:hypothetical protein [Bacillus sp. TH13]MBK5492607.1 hypothetical protein [Bacillus sp. TH13]